MAKPKSSKDTVNVYVDKRLAAEFRKAANVYYGRLGHCYSAAMMMFLEADPNVQGEYMKRVYASEVDGQVETMIERIKAEQAGRIATRESGK